LVGFRREFYACLTARADALFELTDAVLCADGPVTSLVELTLTAEHRRGHGAMYDALNAGQVEPARLRRSLASLPLPRVGGRIVLAVDVSPWLRPDAATSGDRLFCHVYGRAKNNAQLIPGWPYSFVAALETGRRRRNGRGRSARPGCACTPSGDSRGPSAAPALGSAAAWVVGLVVGAGRSSGGRRAGRASAAGFGASPAAVDAAGWAAACSVR
jgi:hypothetical protein